MSVRSEDLVLLDRPHFVDYSFENALYGVRGQGTQVVLQNVGDYLIFTFGFINGKTKLVLYTANLLNDFGAPVKEVQKLNIELIDRNPAVSQIFESHEERRGAVRRHVNCSSSCWSSEVPA